MLAWKYLFARRWSIFFYFTIKQYNARFDWYLIKNDGETEKKKYYQMYDYIISLKCFIFYNISQYEYIII